MLPRPPAARRALHTEGELIAFMRLYRHGGHRFELTVTDIHPDQAPATYGEPRVLRVGGRVPRGGGVGRRLTGTRESWSPPPSAVEVSLADRGQGTPPRRWYGPQDRSCGPYRVR